MCRVYRNKKSGPWTRLCYRTGHPGARVAGDQLHGRRHVTGKSSRRTRKPEPSDYMCSRCRRPIGPACICPDWHERMKSYE